MCTATFIPQTDGFIFTSNRDESLERETIPPKLYEDKDIQLAYPKDAVAGGTWIGVSSQKRLVCLLNGGFKKHLPAPPYRMSRGVVVTQLLKVDDALSKAKLFDFKNIEPFTIILIDWVKDFKLHQIVWDGNKAHFNDMPLQPTIWSSSLLYTPAIKREREQWFSSFLNAETIHPSSLLRFHKTAGNGDEENSLVMKRSYVSTKSITQIILRNSQLNMQYEDLQTKNTTSLTL